MVPEHSALKLYRTMVPDSEAHMKRLAYILLVAALAVPTVALGALDRALQDADLMAQGKDPTGGRHGVSGS